MPRFLRLAGLTLMPFLGLAVLPAASGWLYFVGPHSGLPGPRVADALPLDALSHRSAIPLLLFVAAWSAAALTLGVLARAAGMARLTAALVLTIGVASWSFATTGI